MAEHQGIFELFDTAITFFTAHQAIEEGALYLISTEKSRSGTYSLMILPRSYKKIWYGCDAGNKIISIYCWSSIQNTARMRVIDPDTLEIKGEAKNNTVNQWEKLEIQFTTQKKVYLIELMNLSGVGSNLGCKVYFDDLE